MVRNVSLIARAFDRERGGTPPSVVAWRSKNEEEKERGDEEVEEGPGGRCSTLLSNVVATGAGDPAAATASTAATDESTATARTPSTELAGPSEATRPPPTDLSGARPSELGSVSTLAACGVGAPRVGELAGGRAGRGFAGDATGARRRAPFGGAAVLRERSDAALPGGVEGWAWADPGALPDGTSVPMAADGGAGAAGFSLPF